MGFIDKNSTFYFKMINLTLIREIKEFNEIGKEIEAI